MSFFDTPRLADLALKFVAGFCRVHQTLRVTLAVTIEFEPPVENVKWLHLALTAENFGGSGMIRFEIPMAEIMTATKEVRSAAQDYWALKGGQLHPDPVRLKLKSDRLEEAILRLKAVQKGLVVSPQ